MPSSSRPPNSAFKDDDASRCASGRPAGRMTSWDIFLLAKRRLAFVARAAACLQAPEGRSDV